MKDLASALNACGALVITRAESYRKKSKLVPQAYE